MEPALGSTCFNTADHTAYSTTRSMEENTHLKSNSYSASQEIPSLLENARCHYWVKRSPPLDASLSGPNSPALLPENSF